jgi:GH18 family chitinase
MKEVMKPNEYEQFVKSTSKMTGIFKLSKQAVRIARDHGFHCIDWQFPNQEEVTRKHRGIKK